MSRTNPSESSFSAVSVGSHRFDLTREIYSKLNWLAWIYGRKNCFSPAEVAGKKLDAFPTLQLVVGADLIGIPLTSCVHFCYFRNLGKIQFHFTTHTEIRHIGCNKMSSPLIDELDVGRTWSAAKRPVRYSHRHHLWEMIWCFATELSGLTETWIYISLGKVCDCVKWRSSMVH